MSQPLSIDARMAASFDAAIDKVTAALKAEGFGILTRIDVHTTLREKLGVAFRPYAILGACNPALAHQALSNDARAGLILPCNITVEDAGDGTVRVRIGNPDAFLGVGDFRDRPELKAIAGEAHDRLQRVGTALGAK